jgi:hypothetical protein
MVLTVFEPIIPESERPQTHALDYTTPGIGTCNITIINYKLGKLWKAACRGITSISTQWQLIENRIWDHSRTKYLEVPNRAMNFEPSPAKNK